MIWAFRVGMTLRGERLWRFIEPKPTTSKNLTITEPVEEESSATSDTEVIRGKQKVNTLIVEDPDQLEDQKIRAARIIISSVRDSVLPHIMSMRDPKQMWEKLATFYESKTLNRQMTLKTDLYNLRMSNKTSIENHLKSINMLVAQLGNINVVLPEEELVTRIIMSLLESWSLYCQFILARERAVSSLELQ